jgi:hypothetical protein
MAEFPTPSEEDLKALGTSAADERKVAWLRSRLKSAWYDALAEGRRESAETLQAIRATVEHVP